MVAHGRVRNGVVVLDGGTKFAEGQEVTVVGRPVGPNSPSPSVLDVPTVSLGPVLRPLTVDHDLIGEMLDDEP
jgi:hypothetical protein